MSPRLIRRVQRIEALLGEPIGYDGPEGLHPGPGGAERVELVHPSGRPAAWLVSPSLSPERRSALRALTSERLLLIDAIERERRRPGVTDILRRLTGCEEALTAARTVRDVAERIQSGLQGLLGVLDRDALEIEVHPVGDDDPGVARGAGGAPGVCLGPDGRSLRFVVGPPGRGRFAVDLRRPAGVEPTQAAVLNREHTSACALFQRQLDATLAAWHLAFLERVTGDVIDAFHRDRARDPSAGGVAARSSALRDTAAALAVALDA
ncbi:MAG TPA: hypothetical protein PKA64_22905, partial [Myxococcota bacterium]|nr:hypothetical protein [Myxococcota bacterium]